MPITFWFFYFSKIWLLSTMLCYFSITCTFFLLKLTHSVYNLITLLNRLQRLKEEWPKSPAGTRQTDGKNLVWFGEIERKLAKLSKTTFIYRSSSWLFYGCRWSPCTPASTITRWGSCGPPPCPTSSPSLWNTGKRNLDIPLLKGAKVGDFRSIGLSWFLHLKVFCCWRLWG